MRVNRYDEDEKNTTFNISILKRSLKYLKPYYKQLCFVLIISFMANILSLFLPKLLQYMIDDIIPKQEVNNVIKIAILSLYIIIISIVLDYIKSRILNKVKEYIAYDLKNDIFIHLQYLPNQYYDTRPHGKILTRATSYADSVAQCLCNNLLETVIEIINLTFVVIFMFSYHIPLTLFVLIFAIIIALLFIKLTPIRRKKQHIVNNKSSNVNAYVAESINGVSITQAYNREKKNEMIIKELEKERIKSVKEVLPYLNYGWAIAYGSSNIVNVCIYILGFFFFYPQTSIGTIIAIGNYSGRFWGPIRNITSVYSEIMDAITYLERIFELLDEPLVIENMKNPSKKSINGKVEFKNVGFSYIEGIPVLENLNFKIEKKQTVAIVGETGSGKSTIINLLARYYDIDNGSILIDDIPLHELELGSLRSQINVMLQDNYLFSKSIFENITYGKRDAKLEEVINVCKEIQIHDWIMSLKDGYNTVLHNNGKEISTGQKQLICFARTIIANPKILILDEATSNVDLKTEKLVQNGLHKLLKNRTSIIIAHRLSTITDCDKIMVLKNKTIYESGTHQELMNKKGEYYKLYTSQL